MDDLSVEHDARDALASEQVLANLPSEALEAALGVRDGARDPDGSQGVERLAKHPSIERLAGTPIRAIRLHPAAKRDVVIRERLGQQWELVRRRGHVRIREDHEVPCGRHDPGTDSGALPAMGDPKQVQPGRGALGARHGLGPCLDDTAGGVAGAVVHDEDVPVAELGRRAPTGARRAAPAEVAEQFVQRARKAIRLVVGGQDEREARMGEMGHRCMVDPGRDAVPWGAAVPADPSDGPERPTRYPVGVMAVVRAVRPRSYWVPRAVVCVAVAAGLTFLAYTFLVQGPVSHIAGADAFAYWSVGLADPYHAPVGEFGAFTYSPPIAAIAGIASLLPWRVFLTLWTVLLLTVTVWLGGRRALLVLAFPPVVIELYYGNINLLLAAAIVVGMTRPWSWAFVLLTKPTCGVGLLWFAARREWQSLAIAVGATLAIAGTSMVLLPGAWHDWIRLLLDSAQHPPTDAWLPVPIWLRLPIAGALVWWGARSDRPWTVAAAATIALPVIWFAGLAILVAALRTESRRAVRPAPAPVRLFEGQRAASRAA